MRLLNLTPHAITIAFGDRTVTIPPSGNVARVRQQDTAAGSVLVDEGEIPLVRSVYGEVYDLPDEIEDGTIALVSAIVLNALRDAGDPRASRVAAPDGGPASAVRDADGRIVAVRRLIVA